MHLRSIVSCIYLQHGPSLWRTKRLIAATLQSDTVSILLAASLTTKCSLGQLEGAPASLTPSIAPLTDLVLCFVVY